MDHTALANNNQGGDKHGFWLWSFLGRLHPMIVHFPISLLYAALLFEAISWKRKSAQFKAAAQVMVYAGSISAILAVVLGLILSNTDDYGSSLLPVHQWLGIATMVFACITAYYYLRKAKKFQLSLLIITIVGVTVSGHYGAELTHGEDFLTSVLPSEETTNSEAGMDSPSGIIFANQKGPLSSDQIQDLNLQVRTILAHNCYSCHGPTKTKGDLRLDTKEFIFKGGKDGRILVPGNPGNSEILRRVKLTRSNKKAMPAKGKGLTPNEIATLAFWIGQGAPWPIGPEKSIYKIAALEPRIPAIPAAEGEIQLPIDRFVNVYFKKNKVAWQKPVSDRLYIRRVYLDIIGLLPAPESVDSFLRDSRPDKRSILALSLLSRNDGYAFHWLSFWNDALRNDYDGPGYIDDGRWDITGWLFASLQTNKPYNIFVKELINPDSASKGFISGIKWRGAVNASQRTEMQAAQNVSQVFLGLNLKCASCHNSFISDWKLEESYAFANIFSDSAMEIYRCDKPTGKMADRRILFKELGDINPMATRHARLQQLADSLTQPKNGRLYRTLVNRVWAQLMGRGIIEPVDMMDNEPWSQDLLDWMASDFTTNGYDIRKLLFDIVVSKIYQQPSMDIKNPALINSPGFIVKGMVRRRMTAEQFADAFSQSVSHIYADSMMAADNHLPTFIKTRAPFPRAVLVPNDPFLRALGRPNRETVVTSRQTQANLLQALELTNGIIFNEAIKRGAAAWKGRYGNSQELVKAVFRNMLGRLPELQEEQIALKELGRIPKEADIQDLIWSVSLHPEFQLIY